MWKRHKQLIWQSLLEYVGIAWETSWKEAKKGAICGKCNGVWGGNKLLCHMNSRATSVGLSNHVKVFYSCWVALVSLSAPKRACHSLLFGSPVALYGLLELK